MLKWGPTINESAPPLCDSCSNAGVIKGDRLGDEIRICQGLHPTFRLTFKVRECSMYRDQTRQDLHELKRIGWVLEFDKRDRSRVGFRAPTKKDLGLPWEDE